MTNAFSPFIHFSCLFVFLPPKRVHSSHGCASAAPLFNSPMQRWQLVRAVYFLVVKSVSLGLAAPAVVDFSQVQASAGREPQAHEEPATGAFSVAERSQLHWPAGLAWQEQRAPSTLFSEAALSQVQLRACSLPQEHLACLAVREDVVVSFSSPGRGKEVGREVGRWERMPMDFSASEKTYHRRTLRRRTCRSSWKRLERLRWPL